MTAPREILPGRTYLVTRRCTQRQFLLRPDARTNAIFAYCLAEAAQRYRIGVVAWLAMSNHYHAVVHDPDGRLPAFLEQFHKMLAKALNARWGRWENLWSTEETCVTYLPTPQDVFDKVVYVLANPAAEDLVDRLGDWPGCSSLERLNTPSKVVDRPKSYFRPNRSAMPARVELRAVLPPDIAARESAEGWAGRVREALAEKERVLRTERLRLGRRVVGRKVVLRASPVASPLTTAPRRKLKPCLACKDHDRRSIELARLIEFRSAHERARVRFVAGNRHVEFPAGTYRMRVWGALCAPAGIAASTTAPLALERSDRQRPLVSLDGPCSRV